MTNNEANKAVIYSRVARDIVLERSDSLRGQEERCREYAQTKGYSVVSTFQDVGSGNGTKRSGMTAMLEFLDAHRNEGLRVLLADPQRLSRNAEGHMQLLSKIRDAGGHVEIAAPRLRETAKHRDTRKAVEREQER